jgi:hypothetical protein
MLSSCHNESPTAGRANGIVPIDQRIPGDVAKPMPAEGRGIRPAIPGAPTILNDLDHIDKKLLEIDRNMESPPQ